MRLFRFLMSRVRGAWQVLAGALLAGAVSGASSVGLLVLIHDALKRTELGTAAVASFVGLCALVPLSRVGSLYVLERLSQGMVMDLRLELIRGILGAPLRRLEQLGPSRLLVTLTDDVGTITQALVNIPVLGINGTIVLGCFGYLAVLDRRLFLLLSIVVAVGVLTYQIPARLGVRRLRQAREEQNVLYGHFRSLLEGIKELKLHRLRRGEFVDLVTATSDLMRRLNIGGILIFGAAAAWGHLLFFVVIGLLLFANPGLVGADQATLVGYTVVLLYMMTPLQILLNTVPMLGRADVAVGKVTDLGLELRAASDPAEEGPVATTREASRPWASLRLEGVTHSYRHEALDSDFTLGPVELTLVPGEVLFIIGGNGSGKTTLAKLLAGLYTPESGTVRIDGRAVTNRDDQRQLFSVVFSDFFLFDQLLGLASPELDVSARRYLAELRIGHKVEVRGGRLSTVELSQGQRKRLALLTAYLEDRPIYLFDEWAADQDPIFKDVFYLEIIANLKRRNKAVVVISHDDRYHHLADRILKLEDGRVLFDGSSEELFSLPLAETSPASGPSA